MPSGRSRTSPANITAPHRTACNTTDRPTPTPLSRSGPVPGGGWGYAAPAAASQDGERPTSGPFRRRLRDAIAVARSRAAQGGRRISVARPKNVVVARNVGGDRETQVASAHQSLVVRMHSPARRPDDRPDAAPRATEGVTRM